MIGRRMSNICLVNFEIERVSAGWFDASFSFGKEKAEITASDAYGNDGPKILLENGKLMMPVSVRLNHAIADGFLVANVFRLLEKEIGIFCNKRKQA